MREPDAARTRLRWSLAPRDASNASLVTELRSGGSPEFMGGRRTPCISPPRGEERSCYMCERRGGSCRDDQRTTAARLGGMTMLALVSGCGGPQSALETAGRDAERLAHLFYWITGGALVIWIAVVGLAVYAVKGDRTAHSERAANWLVIGGGVAFPTVVLAALLTFGLATLPEILAPAPAGSLTIEVSGEQWWWRVRYLPAGGDAIELANEIRLPVGQRVELRLSSPDVIHSFWVPSIAGKMDMIPGRVTRLALEPTRTGVFRGVCAEYCGSAHALMHFAVVVLEPEDFSDWLARQAQPAVAAVDPVEVRGRTAFLANGCSACHTVRGTPADGRVGPDLTHVGSRLRLGAGILENEPAAFRDWIARTDLLKPGVHMPAFGMLPADDLTAIARWLERLE